MPSANAMMKWMACVAITTSLTACSYKRHFENSPSDYGSRTAQHEATGYRTYNTQLRAADHNNTTMSFSQTDSDVIDDMKGIRSSFVILTDKNVYVAILLDGTATGAKGKGTRYRSDRTIASPGVDDHSSIVKPLQPGDIAMEKYSFPTIPNPQDISSELQTELTQKIRELHPDKVNVFLSANADFINQFSRYAHEAWRGAPLQPYVPELNALVQDHFGDHGIIDLTP
ncbi:hypothetical protein [Paenibacillus koleovorans]|uniref:hypothetical protein n=1 Tax=Paenibacillus koleovorans TaxID=121608 RepID=UPI000FDBE0AD|nr:hypothetical protein [Paenibacillus koleovorans]